MESLVTGRIDVGLLRPPIAHSEFTTLKVAEEHLVAALPVGDPRLAEATLTLKHFHRQPLIMYAADGARYFHDMLAGLFEAEGVAPITIQSLARFIPCWPWCAPVSGRRWCRKPPCRCISTMCNSARWKPIRLMPVELFAAWRSDNDNPALSAFLDLLRPEPNPAALDALAVSKRRGSRRSMHLRH